MLILINIGIKNVLMFPFKIIHFYYIKYQLNILLSEHRQDQIFFIARLYCGFFSRRWKVPLVIILSVTLTSAPSSTSKNLKMTIE